MCGPQVRLLSIVTPNTLWSLTSVICWLPTERCADGEWSSCRFWRVVRIMYFVLDGLRDIWLRCVHWTTSERHDWRTVVTAGTSNVSHPGLKEYLILLFFWGACLSRTLRNTEYQVANVSSGSVWLYTLSKGALLRSFKNSLSSNLAKELYVKLECPTLGIFTPLFWTKCSRWGSGRWRRLLAHRFQGCARCQLSRYDQWVFLMKVWPGLGS